MTEKYRTLYGDDNIAEFDNKKDNDDFAKGVELMVSGEIIKQYWQPYMKDWFRYHNAKECKL